MQDSKPEYFVPLLAGHLLPSETSIPSIDVTEYYHTVGKVIFLTHTEPDIAYACGNHQQVHDLRSTTTMGISEACFAISQSYNRLWHSLSP